MLYTHTPENDDTSKTFKVMADNRLQEHMTTNALGPFTPYEICRITQFVHRLALVTKAYDKVFYDISSTSAHGANVPQTNTVFKDMDGVYVFIPRMATDQTMLRAIWQIYVGSEILHCMKLRHDMRIGDSDMDHSFDALLQTALKKRLKHAINSIMVMVNGRHMLMIPMCMLENPETFNHITRALQTDRQ